MYDDVLQYYLKWFINKLKQPTQTDKLHASHSASHRCLVLSQTGGGHYHTGILNVVDGIIKKNL